MKRKTKKPAKADRSGLSPVQLKPAKPSFGPLASQGRRGGFSARVKPVPLPGKSRGR